MFYVKRFINVQFIGPASVNVTGHRISARIVDSGTVGMGSAELAIYGLPLKTMNQLATFGTRVHPQYDYKLIVTAGDEKNGMSTVFRGTITQAWADFQSAPDVPFHVVAQAGLIPAVMAAKPDAFNSYSGDTDVAQMMQKLATQAGLAFENNGVNVKLNSPYHWGSPRNQMKAVAEAAGIEWIIENDTLAIWPMNKSRNAKGGLLLSRETGMVSYPTFTDYGVLVKAEFTRSTDYGTSFTVQSDVTPANGEWSIRLKDYDLQSLVPKGHWFITLGGIRDASGAIIPNP